MATLAEYDEVVLWFEFDQFCQTNLWFLLHKLAAAPPQVRLSLVSPGSGAGIEPFYGMGQLSPHQLMGFFAERVPITPEVIAEGRAVWTAYAQADPEALLAFAQKSTQPFAPPSRRGNGSLVPLSGSRGWVKYGRTDPTPGTDRAISSLPQAVSQNSLGTSEVWRWWPSS
ncbi:MAG: hypothetical protein AAF998_03345 [Bacteroidota bacterium]